MLFVPSLCTLILFFVCFVYFFGEGSRVCTRNSHSGVLVTGLASTPPRSSTRAPPGAQGLLCPIVFIPAQSCLLAFGFSWPGNIHCRPHLESESGPLPHWMFAGRRFSTLLAPHPWYQTRREVPITWPFFKCAFLSPYCCLCPAWVLGTQLPEATLTFPTLGESASEPFHWLYFETWRQLEAPAPGSSRVLRDTGPQPNFHGASLPRIPLPRSRSLAGPTGHTMYPWIWPSRWAGSKRGVPSLCPCAVGSYRGSRREVCPLSLCGTDTHPGAPCNPHPEERVDSNMVAPSAGKTRKCHSAGVGGEKWAQIAVLSLPMSGPSSFGQPGWRVLRSPKRDRAGAGHSLFSSSVL